MSDSTRNQLDPYEEHVGPFYRRADGERRRYATFKAERRHLNSSGHVHGGALMSFADFSLFWIASRHIVGRPAVTVSFNSEFVRGAKEGDLIVSEGEVVRSTASLVFVRGQLTATGDTILIFSAILKSIERV